MKTHQAIVCDIEGTTTSISFVYDVLFPFAERRLPEFVRALAQTDGWAHVLGAVRAQAFADRDVYLEAHAYEHALEQFGEVEATIDNLLWQMSIDRKTSVLKELQGKIWREGYEAGLIRGQVYDDVPAAFVRWKAEGKRVAIYSSGSVEAQRLLFGHSEAGDLSPHLDGWFDTRTGPKREAASYTAIAQALRTLPGDVLFCTDILEEAQAAAEAGLDAVILLRPGNRPQAPHSFPTATSFADLH